MAETLIPHIYQVVVKLCVAFQFTTIGHYSDTLVPQKNLLCHTPWHKMFQFFCKGYPSKRQAGRVLAKSLTQIKGPYPYPSLSLAPYNTIELNITE